MDHQKSAQQFSIYPSLECQTTNSSSACAQLSNPIQMILQLKLGWDHGLWYFQQDLFHRKKDPKIEQILGRSCHVEFLINAHQYYNDTVAIIAITRSSAPEQ